MLLKRTRNRNRVTKKQLNAEKHECVKCKMNIVGRDNIVKHYKAHGNAKIKKNKEEAKHMDKYILRCDICLQEFLEKAEYVDHQKNYHKINPFLCTICNKCFKRAQHFIEHMIGHESGPIKCPDCDFTTTAKVALQRHRKAHPNFENPFKCKECDAMFAINKDLIAHKKKEHPKDIEKTEYECPICQKIYYRIKRLKVHIKTHSDPANNTCICDICGKTISKRNYELHKRIHTGYKPHACPYCEKSFVKKIILTSHIRVHSGEKPFACEYCGKCFSQRTPLTVHLRLHTGERPYVCQICNKGFISKGSLDLHKKHGNH